MNLQPTDTTRATIRVWDSTGNAKATVHAYRGDEIEYKRNGQRGWMRCSVFDIGDGRLTLAPVAGGRRFSVPITSDAFAQLYRRGARVLP